MQGHRGHPGAQEGPCPAAVQEMDGNTLSSFDCTDLSSLPPPTGTSSRSVTTQPGPTRPRRGTSTGAASCRVSGRLVGGWGGGTGR